MCVCVIMSQCSSDSEETVVVETVNDDDGVPARELKKATNLGKKTIGLLSGIILNVNNLVGPGVLAIPLVFQQAGWLPCVAILLVVASIASFSATYLAEVMTIIPGNEHFEQRREYSTIVKYFFGTTWYYVTQVFYNATLTTMNIPQIIVTAQVMDQFFIFLFRQTYAIQLYPPAVITDHSTAGVPFHEDAMFIVSLGYVVSLLLCMPLGFLNLDENIYFQYLSFGVLVGLLGEFYVYWSAALDLDTDAVAMIGDNYSQVFGVMFFSFIFVVTVPSWLNEKRENVNVNQGVWFSTSLSLLMYVATGLLGSMAYPNISSLVKSGDILSIMALPSQPVFLQVSTYVFSFCVVGLGIPLYSVVIRYNLYVGGICGRHWSAFWGVVFPWLVSFLFYQGSGLLNFVNLSALYVSGIINFIVPFVLYIKARHVAKAAKYNLIPQEQPKQASAYGSVNEKQAAQPAAAKPILVNGAGQIHPMPSLLHIDPIIVAYGIIGIVSSIIILVFTLQIISLFQ